MMARVSSRTVADRSSSPRVEIVGWVATLAFVAFSYWLRRVLNRSRGGGV